MKRTYAAILALLVATTWLALWHGPSTPKASHARDDASETSDQSPAPLPPTIVLPPAIHKPSAAIKTAVVARPAANTAPATNAASEPRPNTEHGAGRSAARDSLKGTWYSEPHDDAKTQQIHSFLLETAAAAALPPEVIQETDCGATVCRVLLSFKGPEQALSFQAMAQRPDFKYEINDDGRPLIATSDAMSGPTEDGEQAAEPIAPSGQNGHIEFEVMLMASNDGEHGPPSGSENAP